MAEERQLPQQRLIKPTFVGDSDLPIHYVNVVNVRAGQEEFYITLGTVVPPEVASIEDLDAISLEAHSLFRFAVSRNILKQIIDVLQGVYDNQTKQLEMLRTFQKEAQEDGDTDS